MVAVRAGRARDRTARARRGGLGWSLALPPATTDADLALTGTLTLRKAQKLELAYKRRYG
jgi:hypothetical protein